MGLRILSDELEAFLQDGGLLISSSAANHSQTGIQGVAISSAGIRGGELFIGLPGHDVNGGTHACEAIERGAALCLIDQGAVESVSVEALKSCMVVRDTIEALWKLAHWWISGMDIPIVAVTGFAGKTTVKELLAGILVGEGPGFYSQRSENDHIGVPFTLSQADAHHKWGVVEVGTSAPGEVARFSSLFAARVGLITCIDEACSERLFSREAVRQEMLDIARTIAPGGVLLVNGDDHDLYREASELAQQCALTLKSFGSENNSGQAAVLQHDIIIKSVISHGLAGINVTLASEKKGDAGINWEETFQLYLPGVHNGQNVAAALAAALEPFPNLKLDGVRRRFARFRPGVVLVQQIPTGAGVRIFSDCSNSNPRSMDAFLEIAQDEVRSGKRVVVFVGGMPGLGESKVERHREVFARAGAIGASKVIFLGEEFEVPFSEYTHQTQPGAHQESVEWLGSLEQLLRSATSLVTGSESGGRLPDLIMAKGSRSAGLEAIVEFLIDSFGGERPGDASQFMAMDDQA